jgi:5-methylcytosine-specific restriction endonuclease McrA
MTLCSKGHRYQGKTCPHCQRSGASRPELNQRRWKKLSRTVKARDGNACRACGATSNLTVHHIRRGGGDHSSNLITLCYRCHAWAERGNLVISNA